MVYTNVITISIFQMITLQITITPTLSDRVNDYCNQTKYGVLLYLKWINNRPSEEHMELCYVAALMQGVGGKWIHVYV